MVVSLILGAEFIMAVKTTPDYIELLNKAVEREIAVSLQYMLQHAKMEKLILQNNP